MRIRTIKPEFFTHEGLWELEQESGLPIRISFAGLWCCADREGRFKWEPRRLGVQILPYDGIDFSRVLHALTTRAFVLHYRVNDTCFGCIPSFLKHQVINNRESESIIPSMDSGELVGVDKEQLGHVPHASGTRQARVGHASKEEGKGREGKGTIAPASPDAKEKAPPKPREPNPAFDALCEVAGLTGKLTPREASRIGMSLKQIRAAMPDGAELPTVAVEIRHRAENYRKTWPGMTLTDTALVAHWSKMEQGGTGPRVPRNSSEELAMMAENRK